MTSFTDLPPELLDHIVVYLPTARSVANLGASNKSLHALCVKNWWQIFYRARFPSLCPATAKHRSHKDIACSLTTSSKAWDRRAFIARYTEPSGNILTLPRARRVERWERPRGQSIGFSPQLDVYEDTRSGSRIPKEVLAFTAGAEICLRQRTIVEGRERVSWITYLPRNAREGRDDFRTLHLLRPDVGFDAGDDAQFLIAGTAQGELQLLRMSETPKGDVPISHFITHGLPVRSSSVLQTDVTLLAAILGDSTLSLYTADSTKPKIGPRTSVDIKASPADPASTRPLRVWATSFLSRNLLAAGLGQSSEPIHIYGITPTGLTIKPTRKFGLQGDLHRPPGQERLSSIFAIASLPPSSTAGGSGEGQCFLTGAFDGLVRLHDLRSPCEVAQTYIDDSTDSSVYCLLPRGQETLLVGSSRHGVVKVFDLRLGSKAYSYLDAAQLQDATQEGPEDWNLFLQNSNFQQSRGWMTRRGAHSSVYSLASPSASSPYLYAGVEGAVVELAFTSIMDKQPDPAYFRPWKPTRSGEAEVGWKSNTVLDLAMHNQDRETQLRLFTQRSMWDTWRIAESPLRRTLEFPLLEGLDERWKS